MECDFLELETYKNDERYGYGAESPRPQLRRALFNFNDHFVLARRSVARFEVNGRATFLRRTGLCYEVTRLTIRERAYF